MTKNRVKNAAIATGKGLGSAALFLAEGFAIIAEENERQRKIQEHTDALRELMPDSDLLIVRKA